MSDEFKGVAVSWPTKAHLRSIARSTVYELHASLLSLKNENPFNAQNQFDSVELSSNTVREIQRMKELIVYCRHWGSSSGCWLLGEFSIADVMFSAAVVFLRTCGINFDDDPLVSSWMKLILALPEVEQWCRDAQAESEITSAF